MRRAVVAAIVALLALPGVASAQDAFGVAEAILVFLPEEEGADVIAQRTLPLRTRGALTVEFRSDPATCGAVGRCGLSGTLSWRPPTDGRFFGVEYRVRGERRLSGSGLATRPARTSAQVLRSTPDGSSGTCLDANEQGVTLATDEARPTELRLSLFGPGQQFVSRCAGPLLDDLRHVLPVARVSAATLRRGRTVIDFGAEGAFTAAGLTGTVRSTVVVRLGSAQRQDTDDAPRPGQRRRRARSLTAAYSIERVSGGVDIQFAGDSDFAPCESLDACGAAGGFMVEPRPSRSGELVMSAFAEGERPWRDLRAAIGLGPGRGSMIQAAGFARWERDHGVTRALFARPFEPPCTDTASLEAGSLTLDIAGGKVAVVYGAAEYSPSDPLLSRCPGPRLADVAADRPLATGTLPLRAFGRKRVTIRLNRGGAFSGDGYSGRTRPDLTVVLRRKRVVRQTLRVP